jgi:putative membrane protein
MVKLVMQLVLNIFSLYVVATIVPGVHIASVWSAVVAAVVIGAINTFIRPILQILALPISIVTLGVFALLINVFLFYLAAAIVPGFEVQGFGSAFLASTAMFFISWFLHKAGSDHKK